MTTEELLEAIEGADVFAALDLPDPLLAKARVLLSQRMEARTRAALMLVGEGLPYRQAAEFVGLASHMDVFRAANRYDIDRVHLARSRDRKRVLRSVRELCSRMPEVPAEELRTLLGIARTTGHP